MNVKKVLVVVLSAALAICTLAGCSNSNQNSSAQSSDQSSSQNTSSSASSSSEVSSEASSAASSQASSETSELSGTVATNGSTSMEKVIGALSEQFMNDHPGVQVTYDATGSGTGIQSVSEGTCDIGLASRALKDTETGLDQTIIALDGIAIIVNANNAVSDLTVDQIASIFKGEITNWKDLGGADATISCVGRESGSGTRDGFESTTGTKDACKLDQELTSTGAVISAVAANENAIGYASLSAVEGQEGVIAVKVGGVECSEATVLDGTYKVQRPFVLVTKQGTELSAQAQAFFDFATSSEAADLIRGAGAVPAAQ